MLTNQKFSQEIEAFKMACNKANVKPTKRQASKFRNMQGSAYKAVESFVESNVDLIYSQLV